MGTNKATLGRRDKPDLKIKDVVFLRVEQSKKKKKKKKKSRWHLADDISLKIMFDENLAICLSLKV